MNNKEKSRTRRYAGRVLISLVILFLLIAAGTAVLFREELKIMHSIERIMDEKPVYYMEVDGDYYFEEFLKSGGAASDKAVSAFLTKRISKGFYSVDVKESGLACSTISANAPEGSHVWGRNFDWTGSVPIIVRCVPKGGYASISTCDFQNITARPESISEGIPAAEKMVPEGIANKMLAIAALYVPMDGVNETGLCVADLEINEGGMITIDTEKPDLTITTAIRLLLNKAATVEEAIKLLKQYDIYASGGFSHHLAISDAAGASVSIEFVEGELVVADTNIVTNFNLANGNTAAGGENAKERYNCLSGLYKEKEGSFTGEQVKEALAQVSQSEGKWTTQWSIVHEQASSSVTYYFDCNFEKPYRFGVWHLY